MESPGAPAGATSLSPVAAGNQVVALSLVAFVSYGTNLPCTWRQASVYVGRILEGEKPLNCPVVQPAKRELAKQLGVSVPPTRLSRADEVME
jgi:putative ABC transport system substrate-binding protein